MPELWSLPFVKMSDYAGGIFIFITFVPNLRLVNTGVPYSSAVANDT